MTVGLISVLAIGAVLGTGQIVKDTFCTAGEAVASAQGHPYPMICGHHSGGAGGDEGGDGAGSDDTGDAGEDGSGSGAAEGFSLDETEAIASLNFSDQLFGGTESGTRVILVPVASSGPFAMSLAITSDQANDPDREIAACYQIAETTGQFCSPPAAEVSVAIPAEASAVGYRITLPEDARLWTNAVDITIDESAGLSTTSWALDVSRDTPPATLAAEFTFPDEHFPAGTTGTIERFVPVGGIRNAETIFKLEYDYSSTVSYEPCFKMTPESTPDCDYLYYARDTIKVPADASEIGYRMTLPAAGVGAAWAPAMTALYAGGTSEFIVTRENEAVAFALDLDFPDVTHPAGATGYQYRYFDISDLGQANIGFQFYVKTLSGANWTRGACYKLTAASSQVCDYESSSTRTAYVTVPAGAQQIGYAVAPGADIPGPATISLLQFEARGDGQILTGSNTITREQPAISMDIVESIPDAHFAHDATGAQKVYLTPGDRNVDIQVRARPADGREIATHLCIKKTLTNGPICDSVSASYSSYGVSINLNSSYPQIAYAVELPIAPAVEEEIYEIELTFTHTATGQVETRIARIIRDAPPAEE